MTSLVIPVADEPSNPTLPFAIASAKRHAPWLQPLLIGNPLSISHYGARVLPFLHQDPNDILGNTSAMLAYALTSPEVSDPFVWSSDDIYFTRPSTQDDIRLAGATALGSLERVPARGYYGRVAFATAERLRMHGLPTYDYEGHVPLLVNKAEMRRALWDSKGLAPRSLYQNSLLERPARIASDVKFLTDDEIDPANPLPQFFSTGNKFDIGALERLLG